MSDPTTPAPPAPPASPRAARPLPPPPPRAGVEHLSWLTNDQLVDEVDRLDGLLAEEGLVPRREREFTSRRRAILLELERRRTWSVAARREHAAARIGFLPEIVERHRATGEPLDQEFSPVPLDGFPLHRDAADDVFDDVEPE